MMDPWAEWIVGQVAWLEAELEKPEPDTSHLRLEADDVLRLSRDRDLEPMALRER